jgi:hypothetical protein
LRTVFGPEYAKRFAIRLWDGTRIASQQAPEFTLQVNQPGALRTAFHPPVDLNAGRAFAAGMLEIAGDAEAAIDVMMRATQKQLAATLARLLLMLRRLPNATRRHCARRVSPGAVTRCGATAQQLVSTTTNPSSFIARFSTRIWCIRADGARWSCVPRESSALALPE